MTKGQLALKLVLEELGLTPDSGIRRMERSVYLAQVSGVPLSYSFGWYSSGPGSPSLTTDWVNLGNWTFGDPEWKGLVLRSNFKEKIAKVLPLFEVPEDVDLSKEEWLELISSVHYLKWVSDYNEDQINRFFIDVNYVTMYQYIEKAKDILKSNGFWVKYEN